MNSCFDNAGNGQHLDISTYNPSVASNLSRMFEECKYSSIDISGLDASKISAKTSMFYNFSQPCTVWCKDEAAKTALSTGTSPWANVIFKVKGVD